MLSRLVLALFAFTSVLLAYLGSFICPASAQDSTEFRQRFPGLVLGLRHNVNQQREDDVFIAFFTASASASVQRMDGGDLGAPLHRGYEWWMIDDAPNRRPSLPLPPGIVFGLKHSVNQAGAEIITVFGRDPCTGPSSFPGFQRQLGGDLGAPRGQGYCWYESINTGLVDWNLIDLLPRWTVVGLKHSINQRNKNFVWQGALFDPADPTISPPPGFERKFGGDLGAPAGQGYFWYEKVTGPELVVKPPVVIQLRRSLIDRLRADRDLDCLNDSTENELASRVRPFLIFDSHEIARQEHEPVTLFQMRPLSNSPLRVLIKWVFLFRNDGGYGPASDCFDAHAGDNDDAEFELESTDDGRTWVLTRVNLSFKGLEWPSNSRSEWFDLHHIIIYMSGSKHHEYFTRDRDMDDSLYSEFGCNDNVDGRGAQVLADVRTLARLQNRGFNNVGEPEAPHAFPFIDDLSPVYPGQSAWGNKNFFSVDANNSKWLRYSFTCPR